MQSIWVQVQRVFLSCALIALIGGCSVNSNTTFSAPAGNTTHNQWTWVSGSNTDDQPGTYGVQGISAAGNAPGARTNAATWTDKAGNFWMFGGLLDGGLYQNYYLNDLWEYHGGQWTWMGGSNTVNAAGIYGTQGVASPGNMPGARAHAATWTDVQGNFWLFGGFGMDGTSHGDLNDLWEYSGGEWTWVSGSNSFNQPGVYGTLGIASSSNIPSGRDGATSWFDTSGTLWLFGGGSSLYLVPLNDLWKYSGGQWTWMGGSNLPNPNGQVVAGIYGTRGVAAASNTPGPRFYGTGWLDASGDLWLFGGVGYDAAPNLTGGYGPLNDLWKYSAGEWTWMSGSSLTYQTGTYGVQGTPATANTPGARYNSTHWTDTSGTFWLFGGYSSNSDNNDLWKYSNGQWTWVNGSNMAEQSGIYGTQGTGAAADTPGARDGAVSWIDTSGNLWLFGGSNDNPAPLGVMTLGSTTLYFNDLWEYQP